MGVGVLRKAGEHLGHTRKELLLIIVQGVPRTDGIRGEAGTELTVDGYRAKDGSWDAWLSPQVAPWGLVKSTARGTTMTVTRLISGATDHITGTPQKFDPMEMMRGMGRGR